MIFKPTTLAGVLEIEWEPRRDQRGFLARSFCMREVADAGIGFVIKQTNTVRSNGLGLLRGMHFQAEPYPESKIVRLSRGRAFDVAIDLRPYSPSYCQWVGVELDAEAGNAVYIPAGFAHGIQSLTEELEVQYLMSEFYVPEAQRGVRWNDPQFAIQWPLPAFGLSDKDQNYPDFDKGTGR